MFKRLDAPLFAGAQAWSSHTKRQASSIPFSVWSLTYLLLATAVAVPLFFLGRAPGHKLVYVGDSHLYPLLPRKNPNYGIYLL